MPTHFCEMTLETRDLAGLERFYTTAFELPVLAREDDRVWLAVGDDARLGLWSPGAKEFGDRGGRHVHFALSAGAGELEHIGRRLRDLDASARGPVEHDGGDRSLYVEDPEGNLVEVWEFFVDGDGAEAGVAPLADHQSAAASA
jgi:catechol-2,3-dioxygenase